MRHADTDRDTAPSVEYRPVRVEPCVCSGLLVADPGDATAVYWAVMRHRRTLEHQAWLRAMEAWRAT